MGQEAMCTARCGAQTSRGKALLETDALIFRGDFRLSVPLKEVRAVEAGAGQLRVVFAGGEVALDLGRLAEVWAEKIRSPKGRLDKLGVRPDSRVGLLAIREEAFRDELRRRTEAVVEGHPDRDCDLVFLGVDSGPDLEQVASLAAALGDQAALWVVYPKGQKALTENDVLAAGRAAGLKDTKVVRFSETHTALKFVIPLKRRRQTGGKTGGKKGRTPGKKKG
jgi:hypothetical protein